MRGPAPPSAGRMEPSHDQYLGVRPTDDASGVLQDIHWSAGLLGYFDG